MLDIFKEKHIESLIMLLIKNITKLSKDKNAIISLKALMIKLHKSKSELFDHLKSSIELDVLKIMNFKYGNYLVHNMLESWDEDDMKFIVSTILESSFYYAKTKYSSSTIEKCIEKVPKNYFLKGIIKKFITLEDEFKGKTTFIYIILDLCNNQYSRFVVLKVLKLSSNKYFFILKDLIIRLFENETKKKIQKNWKKDITKIEKEYEKIQPIRKKLDVKKENPSIVKNPGHFYSQNQIPSNIITHAPHVSFNNFPVQQILPYQNFYYPINNFFSPNVIQPNIYSYNIPMNNFTYSTKYLSSKLQGSNMINRGYNENVYKK